MNLLAQKLENLPPNPGVYIFKDGQGNAIYIGKAGNIRQRVGSYFHRPEEKDTKTLSMLEKVKDIETIVTDTEKEALILENNLIKEYRPKYNIKLRDDKNYPCLKLSIEEEFPTLSIVRRIKKDRSVYFGPFPSATSLKETLKMIRRIFPIRTCLNTKFSNRSRPCINYEMGRCSGPCCRMISPEQYREIVNQVRMLLEGKNKDLLNRLREKMEEEAEKLQFEKAAKIRDQIHHIEKVIEKQKIVSNDFFDQDVIGIHSESHTISLYILFMRAGRILGGKGFTFPLRGLLEEEVLHSFLLQYYKEGKFIPEQILIPQKISGQNLIKEWLTGLRGKKVDIFIPLRGDKRKLIEMACENAKRYLSSSKELEEDKAGILEELKEKLHLSRIPKKIEAFDISNLQGGYAVGSMVTFEDGNPVKERYRHFRIKTVEGADDYGMMYEVLIRHYRKAVEENDLPDLILLDGGRGQLNVGQEVLKELEIKGVDLISLAKERVLKGYRGSRFEKSGEKIFHPQFKEPLLLAKSSNLLHFLDRIRDEAHRFAIAYHKRVRKRETVRSNLDEISGIGEIRKRELLKYFGSIEKIKGASIEELAKAPKMNLKMARIVYEFFRTPPLPSSPEST